MKLIVSFLAVMMSSHLINAQTTLIPDPIFEQALIDLGYDAGAIDGSVLTANINGITNLYVNGKNITDLAGIEDFTALQVLKCIGNQLTTLNISQNTALIELRCHFNQLSNLNVTNNTALKVLQCDNNLLTNLNVSQNINLTALFCDNNLLTNIDVSNNPTLFYFYCFNNQITSLNVSSNSLLLDFYCYNNQLTCLNIKNGPNQLSVFDARNNPNLTCIEVDNVAWSNLNLIKIDPQMSFNTSCQNPCNIIAGVEKVNQFSNILGYPNPSYTIFNLSYFNNNFQKAIFTLYDITGRVVQTKNYHAQNKGTQSFRVNVNHLKEGTYFYTLQVGEQNYQGKMVKME